MPRVAIDVLVADRHPLLLDAMARAVRQVAGFQLTAALADGWAVLEELERRPPDVAVIGVDLPDLPGPRIAAAAARDALPTHVLVIADDDRLAEGYDSLRTGAAGVLGRSLSAEQLVAAIRRAAAGESVLCDRAQTAVTAEIRRRDIDGRPSLSSRERQVLALIAEGLSVPAIARRLQLSAATVRTHVNHLFEKLGASERAQLVALAMRTGLLE